jgi:hypothetical protein
VLDLKAGKLFFDSPKVMRSVDRATRRVLSRFGAFVRRTARSSIRRRKRTSAPGRPPSSHTGLLRRFIWFAYEPGERSVVIGPVRLNRKNRGQAPSLLEHGGAAMLRGKRKTRRAVYRPRPFMGPAFEKERPNLPRMWRDSVR